MKPQQNISWEAFKQKVYYSDSGILMDVLVLNTTLADWEIWVDFVNRNYRVEWYKMESEIPKERIDFGFVEKNLLGNATHANSAHIFTGKIQINSHFFWHEEIENDLDPREFKTIEEHYSLIEFLIKMSTVLEKEVIVTPENGREYILISVNQEKVEFPNITTPVTTKKQLNS
ncbi:MAG: hypothetical protein ACI85I_001745 [Arenicella sp.]|jgi:hypothetical protein